MKEILKRIMGLHYSKPRPRDAALIVARRFQPRPWDEPHMLFLTLIRHPNHDEEVILLCQGKEVPREKYNFLLNKDTGDLHIYMRDATWGDCCQAQAQFRLVEGGCKVVNSWFSNRERTKLWVINDDEPNTIYEGRWINDYTISNWVKIEVPSQSEKHEVAIEFSDDGHQFWIIYDSGAPREFSLDPPWHLPTSEDLRGWVETIPASLPPSMREISGCVKG